MTGRFLARGLLAGMVAGLAGVIFAMIFGEPSVDRAIAFEDIHNQVAGLLPEPELVSRAMQKSLGLLTAGVSYGAAMGGLLSLVFAALYGRVRLTPRTLAAVLATVGYVALVVVPQLKYPANPPAVGTPETIGLRTALYFEMMFVSVAALILAGLCGRRLAKRLDPWHAWIVAGVLYGALVMGVQSVLPVIDEVPGDFPAVLLWKFRIAALGLQATLWSVLGLGFGELMHRYVLSCSKARQQAV